MIDFLALLKSTTHRKKDTSYQTEQDINVRKLRKKAQLMWIEFHYFPPYSPNLNPIERL